VYRSRSEAYGHTTSKFEKKKTIGLGGAGKLTGKLIDELSIDYGLAIRRNTGCIEDMKKEIWALPQAFHRQKTAARQMPIRCRLVV